MSNLTLTKFLKNNFNNREQNLFLLGIFSKKFRKWSLSMSNILNTKKLQEARNTLSLMNLRNVLLKCQKNIMKVLISRTAFNFCTHFSINLAPMKKGWNNKGLKYWRGMNKPKGR